MKDGIQKDHEIRGKQMTDNSVRIKSVSDLFRHLVTVPTERTYYRGESNQYLLLPKLLRQKVRKRLKRYYNNNKNDPVKVQEALMRRFRRYAAHYNRGAERPILVDGNPTPAQWICVAQHHNLPTLLLDWTLNPLVALYFAVWHRKEEVDGRLWAMRLKEVDDRQDLTVHLEDEYPFPAKADDWHSKLPEHRGRPLVIVPCAFTRRIEVQAGRFIYYSGGDDNKTPLDCYLGDKPWLELQQFCIPKEAKEAIELELNACLVSERTLFPDLDGCARYLANDWL